MLPKENDALVPCPHCQQHHRAEEVQCPHCGAALDLVPAAVDESFLEMRIMYGPSNFAPNGAEGSGTNEPADSREEPWQQDGQSMRAMYGPPSYDPGENDPPTSWFRWLIRGLILSACIVLAYMVFRWAG